MEQREFEMQKEYLEGLSQQKIDCYKRFLARLSELEAEKDLGELTETIGKIRAEFIDQ